MNYAIKEATPSSLLEPGICHDLRNLLACLDLDVEHLSRHSATHLCDCHCCKTSRSASARAMKGVQRIEALLLNAQSPAFATTGRSAPPADRTREPPIPIREILTEVVETLEPAIPRGMRIGSTLLQTFRSGQVLSMSSAFCLIFSATPSTWRSRAASNSMFG